MFFTISSCLIAFIAFALLLHLAIFHVYINHVGITTYEYVRAHRLLVENPSSNVQNTESEDQSTNSSNCCQIFKSKGKVAPASLEDQKESTTQNNENKPNHLHRNGGKSTVEKLPPIFPPSPPKPAKQVKVEEVKGSAVPKLPKLVEDNNGSSAGKVLADHNASRSRPHLARVQKHLESIDVEDQDKIYVVEVS